MGKRKITRDSKAKAGDNKCNNGVSETMSTAANDENAINREIATLLLNLHSSTGRQSRPSSSQENTGHAEDLTTKKESQDSAMDLSKKDTATQNVVAASGKVLPNSSTQSSTANAEPNFSFYPSLASMAGLDSSSIPGLNSSYLLQNLLIGKMHQLAGGAKDESEPSQQGGGPLSNKEASTANSLAFPTQPLPAQALTLAPPPSLKAPPVSVLKSIPSSSATALASVTSSSSPKDTIIGSSSSASVQLDSSAAANNIPLLCGQIVAQLNGLLFLVHGLSDPQIELSLQTQLGAIFTRLQELVSIVEQAKSSSSTAQMPGDSGAAKSQEDIEDTSGFQHSRNVQINHEMVRLIDGKAHGDLSSAHQMQGLQPIPVSTPNSAGMHPEVESTSNVAAAALVAAARRRRGRPPKGQQDGSLMSQTGGDKRAKLDETGVSSLPSSSTTLGSGVVVTNGSAKHGGTGGSGGGGGGGKGIRNRVFCGECMGCLKNDDCGRCRYCKDKTKFGGQNRLRQKCLHRRCQMDTHRRRPSATGKPSVHGQRSGVLPNPADDQAMAAATLLAATVLKTSNFPDMVNPASPRSPSPNAIYSGVDLARLAASNTTERDTNGTGLEGAYNQG